MRPNLQQYHVVEHYLVLDFNPLLIIYFTILFLVLNLNHQDSIAKLREKDSLHSRNGKAHIFI